MLLDGKENSTKFVYRKQIRNATQDISKIHQKQWIYTVFHKKAPFFFLSYFTQIIHLH